MAILGAPLGAPSASRFKVCVDGTQCHEPFGTIISPYLPEPLAFMSMMGMVNQVDEWLTRIGYPRAYNTYRSFSATKVDHEVPEKIEVNDEMSEQVFQTKLGDKMTFIIQVQFRQNSTWQGTITWAEEKKTQHFRSTLEMIKLMDSAMAAQQDFLGWEESTPETT